MQRKKARKILPSSFLHEILRKIALSMCVVTSGENTAFFWNFFGDSLSSEVIINAFPISCNNLRLDRAINEGGAIGATK